MRETDNLALEYQAMYRDSRGNLRFANGIYDADRLRPGRVLGAGFFEKADDVPFVKRVGVVFDDSQENRTMIRQSRSRWRSKGRRGKAAKK